MSKPSWRSAPDWANWLAMDSDGTWYWYENEPYISDNSSSFIAGGKCLEVLADVSGWEDSVEKRPTDIPSTEGSSSGKDVDGWSF